MRSLRKKEKSFKVALNLDIVGFHTKKLARRGETLPPFLPFCFGAHMQKEPVDIKNELTITPVPVEWSHGLIWGETLWGKGGLSWWAGECLQEVHRNSQQSKRKWKCALGFISPVVTQLYPMPRKSSRCFSSLKFHRPLRSAALCSVKGSWDLERIPALPFWPRASYSVLWFLLYL